MDAQEKITVTANMLAVLWIRGVQGSYRFVIIFTSVHTFDLGSSYRLWYCGTDHPPSSFNKCSLPFSKLICFFRFEIYPLVLYQEISLQCENVVCCAILILD